MQYRRANIPGVTYFFTVNLQNRKSNLLTENAHHLRNAFRHIQRQHPFCIDGIAILPDHFHMVITLPAGDANFSQRLNLIKGYFSMQIPLIEPISQARKNKRERGIWQRRFWEHLIRNDADFEHHINYIHNNPVKHGYVKRASDWQYSSIHRYIQKNILSKDWAYHETESTLVYGET